MYAESSLFCFPRHVCPSEVLALPSMGFGCKSVEIWAQSGPQGSCSLIAPIFLCPETLYSFLLGQGCGQRWATVAVSPALQSQDCSHFWVISSLYHGVWEQGAVGQDQRGLSPQPALYSFFCSFPPLSMSLFPE